MICWVKTYAFEQGLFVPNKSKNMSSYDYCIFHRLDDTQNCTAVYKTCSGKDLSTAQAVCNVPYRNVRVYGGCLGFKKR